MSWNRGWALHGIAEQHMPSIEESNVHATSDATYVSVSQSQVGTPEHRAKGMGPIGQGRVMTRDRPNLHQASPSPAHNH